MTESQVRALFTEIAGGEPGSSLVDTELARRRGRARLRWRRACAAGAPVAAATAVVAVVLAVGAAGPSRPGTGPVAAGPSAPSQFSPLTLYASFGWLPAGISLVAGNTSGQEEGLTAARTLDSPRSWSLSVDAAGKCHLTGPVSRPGRPLARELKCATPAQKGGPIPVTGRAPAVRGHRAFWTGRLLVWEYARNGWAELSWPSVSRHSPRRAAYQRDAVKIASEIRYGTATPLLFPVQLTGLPSRWRVNSLLYRLDAGVLRVTVYALGAGPPGLGADGTLQYETGLPYFVVAPAAPGMSPCFIQLHESVREINGYRVIVTHQATGTLRMQDLCARDVHGWSVLITELGAHPAISAAGLFGRHVRVLGRRPADWTPKPIG